jgi:hypothetical protein
MTVGTLRRTDQTSWVLSAKAFYDSCWFASRGVADWVIVSNIDEHLYHADMRAYLEKCRAAGITMVPALGYQMIAPSFPSKDALLWRDVRRGVPWAMMNKGGIINPNAIEHVNFAPGRHRATFGGVVRLPDKDEVLNLHYKYLGFDYVFARHREQSKRLLETDGQNRWGHKYFWDAETLQRDIAEMADRSVDVMDADLDHHATHPEPRWWRKLKNCTFVPVNG